MHARLLYWFELSVSLCAVYLIFLMDEWGTNPLPITEFLLAQQTIETEAVWWYVDSGVSRYWNLLTVPLLVSTFILHDETDDFYETLGFVFFGLLAYGFLYLDSTKVYSLCFLIVLGIATGFKLSAKSALRIGYTILVFCACYTWLFPVYSIGLLMYALFAVLFSILVVACLIIRMMSKKLRISEQSTT